MDKYNINKQDKDKYGLDYLTLVKLIVVDLFVKINSIITCNKGRYGGTNASKNRKENFMEIAVPFRHKAEGYNIFKALLSRRIERFEAKRLLFHNLLNM